MSDLGVRLYYNSVGELLSWGCLSSLGLIRQPGAQSLLLVSSFAAPCWVTACARTVHGSIGCLIDFVRREMLPFCSWLRSYLNFSHLFGLRTRQYHLMLPSARLARSKCYRECSSRTSGTAYWACPACLGTHRHQPATAWAYFERSGYGFCSPGTHSLTSAGSIWLAQMSEDCTASL